MVKFIGLPLVFCGSFIMIVIFGMDGYNHATGSCASRRRTPRRPTGARHRGVPSRRGAAGWRDGLARRLRPVLWQVGLASVVINLLALAT
ncbi:MAG: hypothetical protein R6V54_14610, partial [Desulfobacteraceae bacterium]